MTDAAPPFRSALLVSLLVLTAVTAGCTIFDDSDERDVPSAAAVEEKLDSLHTVEATMVSEMESEYGPNRSSLQMITRPKTGQFRAEVLEPESRAGTLIVMNGSTMSMYNRTANEVRVVDVGGLTQLQDRSTESVVEIFEQLNADPGEAETPQDVSTLPMVPVAAGEGSTSVSSLPLYGNASFTYEGTDTVTGRAAYEVRVVPQGDDPIVSDYRIWLDQEWYYPIKTTGQIQVNGANQTVSMVYEDVTFNPTVSNETFEFEPPENATVVNGTTSVESYETREEFAAAVNRSLPDPDVPEGYRFEAGTVFAGEAGEQYSLRYTNGSEQLSVMVQSRGSGGDASVGDEVQIDGRSGTVSSFGDSTVVRLPCGTETYVVTGSEPRETVIDVAASLECESGETAAER